MYEIEKNVSMAAVIVKPEYPFSKMDVGDSFFVPVKESGKLRSVACWQGNKVGRKFSVRMVDGGYRVWRIACAVILSLAFLTPAYAQDGPYITGAIGQSRFSLTAPDGTWRQEGLGYHATKESLAWQAGLGYGWANGWAVEANYIDFGAVSNGGNAVGDEDYRPATKTYNHHAQVNQFEATDQLQAGSLRLLKSFDVGYGFRPFLAAGMWAGVHDLSFWTRYDKRKTRYNDQYGGVLFGPVVGGGLCYALPIASVCGQVDYYRAVSQSGFPISTEIVMPTAALKVPMKGWW